MEKSNNIFIKIDEFVFQKLDQIKAEGAFQKFNDILSALDENQQKTIAQFTTFTFLIIPYLFVAFFWWGNIQTKKSLETKKQILEQIALFDGNKQALNNVSSNYLSPSAIPDQNSLDNKIRNLLSQNSIDQQKVNINNFNQTSTTSNVLKIEAELSFKNFGTTDFSNFIRGLIENERFKITKVDLNKNKENDLLEGTISLMHMGQNAFAPMEE